jgi:hypothetical protein
MAIIPSTAKVLNQYENVNTTYGGSKAMKAQSKWYTMQDVEDTINANKPYKVFTALVSQVGEDNNQTVYVGTDYGPNQLTIGITYTIAGNDTTDFTNVGAPNNEVGTSFIATGTNPNNQNDNGQTYLDYNTGAPVATVLENTIGNIFFEYGAEGIYSIKSDNLFTLDKTFINGTSLANYSVFNQLVVVDDGTNPGFRGYYFNQDDAEAVILNTLKEDGIFDDDIINNPICIEIRVYN